MSRLLVVVALFVFAGFVSAQLCPAGGITCTTCYNTHSQCAQACSQCGTAHTQGTSTCTPTGGKQVCSGLTCLTGYYNCANGNSALGCESDTPCCKGATLTDSSDCGTLMPLTDAASYKCVDGHCAAGTCKNNADGILLGDCDGIASNGCEDTVDQDTQCGTACTDCSLIASTITNNVASATCVDYQCEVVCDANFYNCDGNNANGCESTTQCCQGTAPGTDSFLCDFGDEAALHIATYGCTAGACSLGTATINPDTKMAWQNCDSSVSTGYESPNPCCLQTSNCLDILTANTWNLHVDGGTSTYTCDTASSQCKFALNADKTTGCVAPYHNCDAIGANGCESHVICCDGTAPGSTVTPCTSALATGDGTFLGETDVTDATIATAGCTSGRCSVATCTTGGTLDCNKDAWDGCEATESSTLCGSSCTDCTALPGRDVGVTPTCTTGTCSLDCTAYRYNCDQIVSNGCESTVPCCSGGSAATCANLMEGIPGISATVRATINSYQCTSGTVGTDLGSGACRVSSCTAAYYNCDGNSYNGCESLVPCCTAADITQCTGLANVVANTGYVCATGGICAIKSVGGCVDSFYNCDGNTANGCESETPCCANPAACITANALPNVATYSCASGACLVATCNTGFKNCFANGVLLTESSIDGCETDITTDTNCGACGTVCADISMDGVASWSCNSSYVCVPTCAVDAFDCDGDFTNGCESLVSCVVDAPSPSSEANPSAQPGDSPQPGESSPQPGSPSPQPGSPSPQPGSPSPQPGSSPQSVPEPPVASASAALASLALLAVALLF